MTIGDQPAKFIHVSLGGPMRKISVNGKIIEFEMHPYCGPVILDRHGSEAKDQPVDFLEAASLWAQQGQRMDNGLCRWDHEAKPIKKHMGGKHYKIVGYEEPKRGE